MGFICETNVVLLMVFVDRAPTPEPLVVGESRVFTSGPFVTWALGFTLNINSTDHVTVTKLTLTSPHYHHLYLFSAVLVPTHSAFLNRLLTTRSVRSHEGSTGLRAVWVLRARVLLDPPDSQCVTVNRQRGPAPVRARGVHSGNSVSCVTPHRDTLEGGVGKALRPFLIGISHFHV